MTDLLTAMATPAWVYLAIFGFLTVDVDGAGGADPGHHDHVRVR